MRVSPLVTISETHRAAPNIWARLGEVFWQRGRTIAPLKGQEVAEAVGLKPEN